MKKRKKTLVKKNLKKLKGVKKVKDRDLPISAVIYGRAGSGKTTLASTFPGPILLIDINDQGTNSVSDHKDMDYIELESSKHLEEIYWYLKSSDNNYKTVIIDTISQLQQMMLIELADNKGRDKTNIGSWGTLSRQDWGAISSYLKTWLTHFRNLDMNVLFLAQEKIDRQEEVDDEIINPEVGPRVMASVSSHINADVQMVMSTLIREKITKKRVKGKLKVDIQHQYCLRVGSNSVYITKSRKPKSIKLPEFIINPSYDKIIKANKGEL